ncbi:MAG: rod shape-determining protein MreD [Muribaculaceae bacterium]|nr:rod shape-determining protein MreD [Muribaculaceae bacterium]
MFIIFVLLQAIIFNHICIFNIAIPFVFIIFILRLPMSLNINWVITFSFLLGLSIDVFSDTQGMNALACTLLSITRKPIFNLYFPREDDMNSPIPSIHSIGILAYIKYSLTLTLIYCIFICSIQAFSFIDFELLIIRIIGSTILSFIIIFGFESLINSGSAKRL